MDITDKSNLYGNEYYAITLLEHSRKLTLIKRLIDIVANAVEKKNENHTWSFDGVCYLFARTIVDYSKMAYDNMVLGHFHATHMIIRAIIENCVFLNIVINYDEEELWKYYIVHSFRNTLYENGNKPRQRDIDSLNKMYVDFNISDEFYLSKDGKKPYIERNYGWTYKINNSFSFAGISKLVNETEYESFKIMSAYSHSTSLYKKIMSPIFMENIVTMFINMYIELYRMAMLYCVDIIDDEFYDVSEEFENIVYDFIEYEEKLYNSECSENL